MSFPVARKNGRNWEKKNAKKKKKTKKKTKTGNGRRLAFAFLFSLFLSEIDCVSTFCRFPFSSLGHENLREKVIFPEVSIPFLALPAPSTPSLLFFAVVDCFAPLP